MYIGLSEGMDHKGRKVAMMGGSFKEAGKANRIYVTWHHKGDYQYGRVQVAGSRAWEEEGQPKQSIWNMP